MEKDFKEYNEDVSNALWRDSGNDEITALRQLVAELEKERDEALRVTFDTAVLEEMNKLTAERDALKQQRDELLAALDGLINDTIKVHANGWGTLGANHVRRVCESAIASVKDKQNGQTPSETS